MGNTNGRSTRLLRSLTTQIVQKYRDLAFYVYDKYTQSYPVPSRKVLLSLLPELLQGLSSVRLVIDGIDEWNEGEQKEVLRDLKQLLSTAPSSCVCKMMIASRDTLEVVRSLRRNKKSLVSISLSDGDEEIAINRTIEHLVDNKLSDLPDHFDELDPDASILAQIKRTLSEKANRMISLNSRWFC